MFGHHHLHKSAASPANTDEQSAKRLATLSPDALGEEIYKNASVHLTVATLQQTVARQIDFESATNAPTPSANKPIWDVLKELTSNKEIWRTTENIIVKITATQPTTQSSSKPEELIYTLGVSTVLQTSDTFTVEVLDIASSNIGDEVRNPPPPLMLIAENGSLIPVTENCEMRGRFLFDYQAEACIKFAVSLKEGKAKRYADFGTASGKSSLLAALPSWLRHTAGKHANFICILPNKGLADQFSNNDVRNSDSELHKSVVISSNVTSMEEWAKVCESSGQLLVIDRSEKKYKKKLQTAIANAAIVMVDEAHEILSAKEWALIHESSCVFAVTGTPSQIMQKSFNNDSPVAVFSTNEAILRKKVRGLELIDLGNQVDNDRLFLDAYLNYVGMTHIDIENNSRLFAVAQKSFVFCLDTPAEAEKIVSQLNSFAEQDSTSYSSERTNLQLTLMRAKKKVDDKAHRKIRHTNTTPATMRKKIKQWDKQNPDRSLQIRDFATDIQYTQQEQLAATINAIAMQAIFPYPNKGFDFYQEQIISRKFRQTLAAKESELLVYREWLSKKNGPKKDALLKANPCITAIHNAVLGRHDLARTIEKMIMDSRLPLKQKQVLLEACRQTAERMINAISSHHGNFSNAFIHGCDIDLKKFGACYAELVLENMSDDEANDKLARLNYGFTMNLVSQGLHADKLKFSTGTSLPSVLGVIVAGGSQSDVLSNPATITQMLARGIRGPNGACFMAISTNTHGQRPLVNISDLTPLQPSVAEVSREAYRRSDHLAERREAFKSTRNMFSTSNMMRRVQSAEAALVTSTTVDPTQYFVKSKTEELTLRFRAATAPAAINSSSQLDETEQVKNSKKVTTFLGQFTPKNSDGQLPIDVDTSYSDEDEEAAERNESLSPLF